jgi:hypothetical protein
MLACSDGNVSIFKSDTNHLDHTNAFPSVFGPRKNECRFTPAPVACSDLLHGREQSGPVRAGRGLSEYPEGITSPQDFKGPQEQPHFVMRILP